MAGMARRISTARPNAEWSAQSDRDLKPVSCSLLPGAVEERSVRLRRSIEKLAGGIRSANADMSNDKGGEKPPRRKPKVSCATLIDAGLVGT